MDKRLRTLNILSIFKSGFIKPIASKLYWQYQRSDMRMCSTERAYVYTDVYENGNVLLRDQRIVYKKISAV